MTRYKRPHSPVGASAMAGSPSGYSDRSNTMDGRVTPTESAIDPASAPIFDETEYDPKQTGIWWHRRISNINGRPSYCEVYSDGKPVHEGTYADAQKESRAASVLGVRPDNTYVEEHVFQPTSDIGPDPSDGLTVSVGGGKWPSHNTFAPVSVDGAQLPVQWHVVEGSSSTSPRIQEHYGIQNNTIQPRTLHSHITTEEESAARGDEEAVQAVREEASIRAEGERIRAEGERMRAEAVSMMSGFGGTMNGFEDMMGGFGRIMNGFGSMMSGIPGGLGRVGGGVGAAGQTQDFGAGSQYGGRVGLGTWQAQSHRSETPTGAGSHHGTPPRDPFTTPHQSTGQPHNHAGSNRTRHDTPSSKPHPSGHSYGTSYITGNVELTQGNVVHPGYTGPTDGGASHRYGTLHATGNTRVLQGNQFGGGDGVFGRGRGVFD